MPQGLTQSQVEERVASGKVNKIKESTKPISEILLTNLFSRFNIFFFAVISILIFFYFSTGDVRLLLDGWGIVSLVFVNTVIAIFQEIRAKRMLDSVKLLISNYIHVIRDGKQEKILLENLVQDDIVYIERGDQIPADGKLIKSTRLEIDESLLTGESESIIKKDGDMLLSGSFVISGNGYFSAEKLAAESFAGKITSQAKNFKFIVSPLQKKILRIMQFLVAIAIVLIIAKAVDNKNIGIFSVDAIRQYTTIIISLVPHGLVFLTTVTYVIGIYRISKLGAIVQKINAIEAFSGINIVFTDKTGTLTQNKLSVTNITNLSSQSDPEVEKLLGTYAKYSSYKNSTLVALSPYPSLGDVKIIDELPFSSQTKQSAIKISHVGKERYFLFGGLEILSEKLDPSVIAKIDMNEIKLFRNLLFLEIISDSTDITEAVKNGKTVPICVVSLLDTIREDSAIALELFASKDIDVKILSGDAPFAIQAIAKKVGWDVSDDMLVTGPDLAQMNEEDFLHAVMNKKIFARLAPEQKQQIVNIAKSKGLYTAMIGDGVNDLPAIKRADLGIAMEEGSQVTKEVADIILVENKFSLLPQIFDEGKRIVNSVYMASKLFLTKNISVTIMTLLTVLTSLPFLLTPRKVSFINIFIITFPALLISLYNKDILNLKNFLRDLFTAVLISSTSVVFFAYTAYFLAPNYFPSISDSDRSGIFICVIVYVALANFLSVMIPSHGEIKSKILFSSYALFLVILLFLITTLDLSQTPIGWFKELYEVPTLKPEYWILISAVGVLGGLVLYAAQRIRREIVAMMG